MRQSLHDWTSVFSDLRASRPAKPFRVSKGFLAASRFDDELHGCSDGVHYCDYSEAADDFDWVAGDLDDHE